MDSTLGAIAVMRTRRLTIGLACAVLLGGAAAVRADDQDAIDYRQHIMNTMQEQVAAIDMILKQRAPAENFATHVRVLAVAASTAKSAFQPKVPGGEAKPEVWTNWTDFSSRLDTLVAALGDLEKTANSGGLAAGAPKVQAALSCKGCHDSYLLPKK
jgi:cytochrome c556